MKDSWSPQDRPAEHEFLMLAKGIAGVGQMISFENGRGETKWYRCPTTAGLYRNRVAMRITMKSYGRSVEFFKSVAQFLGAFRDAIAGLFATTFPPFGPTLTISQQDTNVLSVRRASEFSIETFLIATFYWVPPLHSRVIVASSLISI